MSNLRCSVLVLAFLQFAFVSVRAQNGSDSAHRVSLREEKRGKDIELDAAWPKGAEKCPVSGHPVSDTPQHSRHSHVPPLPISTQ